MTGVWDVRMIMTELNLWDEPLKTFELDVPQQSAAPLYWRVLLSLRMAAWASGLWLRISERWRAYLFTLPCMN